MQICALPHLRWNPSPRTRQSSLAELFGEAPGCDAIALPLRLREPHHIFAATTFDLFEQEEAVVQAIFAVMIRAALHEFQIETVRSDRLLKLSPKLDWPSNIWMGVTVERQADLSRIDDLRRSRARVRFVHVLGPVEVGQSDLANIDFVMDTAGELPRLAQACAVASCRLFVGKPESAREHAATVRGTVPSPFESRRELTWPSAVHMPQADGRRRGR